MRNVLCAFLIAATFPLHAAKTKAAEPKPGTPEFDIESTVLAVYNVVSGPAGRRDWDRFEELFAPGAQIGVYENGKIELLTPAAWAAKMKPVLESSALFWRPLLTKVERHKDIAHVTSRYESRHTTTEAKAFARGVAHLELVRSGDNWRVVSMVWQDQ